jgi:hypothetical protein
MDRAPAEPGQLTLALICKQLSREGGPTAHFVDCRKKCGTNAQQKQQLI